MFITEDHCAETDITEKVPYSQQSGHSSMSLILRLILPADSADHYIKLMNRRLNQYISGTELSLFDAKLQDGYDILGCGYEFNKCKGELTLESMRVTQQFKEPHFAFLPLSDNSIRTH